MSVYVIVSFVREDVAMYNWSGLIYSFQGALEFHLLETQNPKEPMSNSGTSTFCFAAFMRPPIPVFLADKSEVSAMSLVFTAESPLRAGDAARVGVADGTSMSMNTEGCRCIRALTSERWRTGEDGRWAAVLDGLSNDQFRTRPRAKA